MQTVLITGGNGFIGRRVVERLAATGDHRILALIRPGSLDRFAGFLATVPGGTDVTMLPGDITEPGLALTDAELPDRIDHVLHLAAVYDMAAGAATQEQVNVAGTERVAQFAHDHGSVMHHVSSIAVSGEHRGRFTEDDFDLGQQLPTPYHRTKFESEKVVREYPGLSWRVYRPAIVVGDSRTGHMDKVDGPYYFFERLALLGMLPSWSVVPFPNLGTTNIVPVDYVADSICALLGHAPELTHATYHLSQTEPGGITDMYNAFRPAFAGPRAVTAVPYALVDPVVQAFRHGTARRVRDLVARGQNIPPATLDATSFTADFRADRTAEILARFQIAPPALAEYGPVLWRYWQENLDTRPNRRPSPRGELVGRTVVITGGSSGIGRATAKMCIARGADVVIVARDRDQLNSAVAELRAETAKPGVPAGSATAYSCDITDEDACHELVATIIAVHGKIDILVNNAGHSIRRSAEGSVHRGHDYRRLMDVNFFGAVYLTLAALPHMRARRAGHIVNVTSVAVQGRGPRFSGYTASKSALEAFSDSVATETVSDHVTFSNVRLPLTRTPMIAPTTAYTRARGVWSPEKAAARVLHAIEKRPARVNSLQGDFLEVSRRVAPSITKWFMHQDYLLSPDSRAARGVETPAPRRQTEVV